MSSAAELRVEADTPEDEYHQSWYAVALSEEVAETPVGKPFLGGRVVVYRDEAGDPVVLGAYCPHLGADLSIGEVVGSEIQCAFHHFRFGSDGACTWAPSKRGAPPRAKVQSFPTAESWGLIWAFNGHEPLFDPPMWFDLEGQKIYTEATELDPIGFESWISTANQFDVVHLRELHGVDVDFQSDDMRPAGDYFWEVEMNSEAPGMGKIHSITRAWGPNTLIGAQHIGDMIIPSFITGTPQHKKKSSMYFVGGTIDTRDGSAEQDAAVKQRVDMILPQVKPILEDDYRVFNTVSFRVGTLIPEDRFLVRFLNWVRTFPTAKPSIQ